jgi:hypothetical protein
VQQQAVAEIAEDGNGAKGRGMAEGREEREGGNVGEGRKEKEVTLAHSREDLSEVGEEGRGGGGGKVRMGGSHPGIVSERLMKDFVRRGKSASVRV